MRSRSSGPSSPLPPPASPADAADPHRSERLRIEGSTVDEPPSVTWTALTRWAHGAAGAVAAMPLQLSVAFPRTATRTGGPDDDGDDELRLLMPVLAAVIALALIFG